MEKTFLNGLLSCERTNVGRNILSTIRRNYNNYNFYFIQTSRGQREIKKIHIYNEDNVVLTLNNPWFGSLDEIDFKECVSLRKEEMFDDKIFCVEMTNKKHVELYIPNRITNFELIDSEKSDGFYKYINIYKSKSKLLNFHEERINSLVNVDFVTKIKDSCTGTKKTMSNKKGHC